MSQDDNIQRIEKLETKILQLQIEGLRQDMDDHEKRLRLLEDTATKFNFLLYLTMGGGLVSIFNLFSIVYLIIVGSQK